MGQGIIMTYTLNGFGTELIGTRPLKHEEYKMWYGSFPIKYPQNQLMIATEWWSALWLPVFPRFTFVIHYLDNNSGFGFIGSGNKHRYQIIYYPAGKKKVYWKHIGIFSMIGFAITWILILGFIIILIK